MFPTCGMPLAFLTSAPPGTTPAGAEAMLGAPAAVGASWRFTAADAGDRADKFGWLGVKGKEGTSSADRISFRLEFSGLGFLAFEFLRSYAWDGRVSIIIDGKRPLLDLGSHWEDQSSQRVTNYLALGTGDGALDGAGVGITGVAWVDTLYFFFFCGICGLLYTTTLDFGEEPARRPPPPSPPPSPPADDAADDGPPL